jgi:hypothetical protein
MPQLAMPPAVLPGNVEQGVRQVLAEHPLAGMPGGGLPVFGALESGAAGTAWPSPVGIDVRLSKKYKRQQQGLLHLRLQGGRLTSDSVVELRAESAAFAAPLVQCVSLEAGEIHELDALRFVPRLAGAEQIRFAVTVKTSTKTPLGRWLGSVETLVEDDEKKKVEAGRDVIIVGGELPARDVPDFENLLGAAGSGWQSLSLVPDRNYNRRLRNACPEMLDPAPPAWTSVWPPGGTAAGAMYIRDRQTGAACAVGVVCGTSASLGRGGDPAVAWWLQPAPYDAYQHGRLSRRHALLTLHDGRAWVTDGSTNGTWLNGERLAPAEICLLASGDRLEPARVVPLEVTLLALRGAVHAVWLSRIDALGEQLRYLLADCQAPVGVTLPGRREPSLWLAWRRAPAGGAEALASIGQEATFQSLGARQDRVLGDRYCLRWQPFSAPLEQPDYLNQLNSLA